MTKEYFTSAEALERVKEALEYRTSDDIVEVGELLDEVAYSDYYITYVNEAKKALEQYGIWEAIEQVQEYELKNFFGEESTHYGNPMHVANMLWHIITEESLYGIDIDGVEVNEALEIVEDELNLLNK